MLTTVKTCFKCGAERPLTDFYKHPQMGDGHLGKCKECTKRDVSENYRKRIDHYVRYDRQRNSLEDRRVMKRAYASKRPSEKVVAQYTVSNAIRDGRLQRIPCEVCGQEKSEAHHDDYSKPLDVRWLCRMHHLEHHGKTIRSLT